MIKCKFCPNEFENFAPGREGRRQCPECRKKYNKVYKDRVRERDKIKNLVWRMKPHSRKFKGVVEKGLTEDFLKRVFEAYEYRCFKCSSGEELSVDHHISNAPLYPDNATILCSPCNSRKSNKQPENFYTIQELARREEVTKLYTPTQPPTNPTESTT